jgi:pyridoxamine 5'-phosphate oxidase
MTEATGGQGTAATDDWVLDADPLRQLQTWLTEARGTSLREPAAMALATSSPDGGPTVRMVLLRGLDEQGLRFFTNYESGKGHDLNADPRAAAVLYWDPLERQARATGPVERLTQAESLVYFASRPRGSRIAAWASPQSQPVDGRATLEQAYVATELRFPGEEIPLPPSWGGYRLIPLTIEFWRGRDNRLHDRLRYTRQADGSWLRERLAP